MMRVYGVPGSPFLASVIWTLEECQAPYTLMPMSPSATKEAEHLLRHPFGRIPAIEHDGFALYETQAILRYVADTFASVSLEPAGVPDRARMNQIIGINDWYFFPKVAAVLVFEHIIKPRVLNQAADVERAQSAIPLARLCIAELERLMVGRSFLAGDTLSIADLHLAPQLYYFEMVPDGAAILSEHRHLSSWLARMKARPAIAKTTLIDADRLAA